MPIHVLQPAALTWDTVSVSPAKARMTPAALAPLVEAMEPAKMPVLFLVSVIVTVSLSPLVLVSVTVKLCAVPGFVLAGLSVMRTSIVLSV